MKQFRLDFGILGISGIDFDGSLLDFDYHEVRVKQAIIDNSRSVFLAVDHTKFGRNAMVKLGNIAQLNMIFTNKQPPEEILAILKRRRNTPRSGRSQCNISRRRIDKSLKFEPQNDLCLN